MKLDRIGLRRQQYEDATLVAVNSESGKTIM